jgi:tRNA (guanosine-2'-O-)-methyltransferase
MRQLDATGMKRLHREWRRRTEGRLALLLDGVGTPVNVGSILRTAAAYGVEHLWLTETSAPPTSAGARKTSLGTERYLEWTTVASGEAGVHAARAAGFRVVGIELVEGGRPLFEVDLTVPVCLVLGHEDHGLARGTIAACDVVAYLPMVGKVGSLNVAQAGAVAMAEVRRQEWMRPAPAPDPS